MYSRTCSTCIQCVRTCGTCIHILVCLYKYEYTTKNLRIYSQAPAQNGQPRLVSASFRVCMCYFCFGVSVCVSKFEEEVWKMMTWRGIVCTKYMYMCVCIYIYIHIYIHTHICIHSMYVCVSVTKSHVYTHIHIYIHF